MSYDDTLRTISGATGRAISHQVSLYGAGYLERAAFQDTVTILLDLASTQGANYGQLAYSQYSQAISGELPETLADMTTTKANDQKQIIRKSVDTILDSDVESLESLESKLQRLGQNLPVQSVQGAYGDALSRDNRAEGWTRGLEPDACELCVWWWREGAIWPKDHPMPTHSGCMCQQMPEFASEIMPTEKTRELGDETLAAQSRVYEEKRKVKDK